MKSWNIDSWELIIDSSQQLPSHCIKNPSHSSDSIGNSSHIHVRHTPVGIAEHSCMSLGEFSQSAKRVGETSAAHTMMTVLLLLLMMMVFCRPQSLRNLPKLTLRS
jgi:hypothetical protein